MTFVGASRLFESLFRPQGLVLTMSEKPAEHEWSMFVGDLAPNTNIEDLKAAFSPMGPIISCVVMRDKRCALLTRARLDTTTFHHTPLRCIFHSGVSRKTMDLSILPRSMAGRVPCASAKA